MLVSLFYALSYLLHSVTGPIRESEPGTQRLGPICTDCPGPRTETPKTLEGLFFPTERYSSASGSRLIPVARFMQGLVQLATSPAWIDPTTQGKFQWQPHLFRGMFATIA